MKRTALFMAMGFGCALAAYDTVITVGTTGQFTTIQAAVTACPKAKSCEVRIASGTYNEQVSVEEDNRIWLHGNEANPPTVRWLDSLSTQPKDSTTGDGSSDYRYYAERNGVIRVINSDSIEISHLKIDAVRHYSFQWENVWGSRWQFNGNSGIALAQSHATHIHDCEIMHAWFGVRLKDRNTGGVFANLDPWELEETSATPFSSFGTKGNHIVERNRIHHNVWAIHFEQTYDLSSTIRYNLIWSNYSNTNDFTCSSRSKCGVPDSTNGDRRYHIGGFVFLKDAMLVEHNFHNNTLYDNAMAVAGYWKAGKNHTFDNNLVSHSTRNLSGATLVGLRSELIGSYSNARNNVLSRNYQDTLPLFGPGDSLWISSHLAGAGSTSPDSFLASGSGNWFNRNPSFLSVDSTSANFLCPDWSKPDIAATVEGKAWAYTSGSTAMKKDVGALQKNGSTCTWGGQADSIGIHLVPRSPVLFSDQTNARILFDIKPVGADSSEFDQVMIEFQSVVDSIPFGNVTTSSGVYPQELVGQPGIIPALKMMENDIKFTFPRSSLGEYGVIKMVVKARHKTTGQVYYSNLGFFEYRRLDYTLDIDICADSDPQCLHPLDTVQKGTVVRIRARVLDLNLNPVTSKVVHNPVLRFLNGSKICAPDNPAYCYSTNAAFFDTTFTGDTTVRVLIGDYVGGAEIANISGLVYDGSSANFTSGMTTFYIKPSAADSVSILNNPALGYRGDTMDIIVGVYDIFGDMTDEPVQVTLSSSNTSVAQVLFSPKTNSDGTLEFPVYLPGAVGTTVTLTATLTRNGKTSSKLFTIGQPSGTVQISSTPASAYANGQIVPVDFSFVADNGSGFPAAYPFLVYCLDSLGNVTTALEVYSDSSIAANNGLPLDQNGMASVSTDSTGKRRLWIRMPASLDSSETYTLQTGPTFSSLSTVWDSATYRFEVPELVFLDAAGQVLSTPPVIDTMTYSPVQIRVEARIGGMLCTACSDSIELVGGTSLAPMFFKSSLTGSDVSRIPLVKGKASFYVYSKKQILNGSFTLAGTTTASAATYPDVTFRRPPVPQVDSAFVYDNNGDGIADSLVVYYEMPIRDSLPDSLVYAWPFGGDSIHQYPVSLDTLLGHDNILVYRGDLTDALLTDGLGFLTSYYTDSDGNIWPQRIDLADRIGPVMTSARLVENYTSLKDTLFVTFSEPLDTSFINGQPFVKLGTVSLPMASGIRLNDTTWVFTLERGQLQAGDSLQLNSLGPVSDANGVHASANNGAVAIELLRRPVPTSQNGNLFQDLDGDGTLDHVVLEFLGNLTQDYLTNDLDSVVFNWIDSAGNPIRLSVPGSAFTIDSKDPRKLHWDVENPDALMPYLTYINPSRAGVQYGTATMYTGLSSTPLPITMTDDMPPVIVSADLEVSETANGRDRLDIVFSEPIAYGDIPDLLKGSEFTILPLGSNESRVLRYSSMEWEDSTLVHLFFGKDIPYEQRPNSQDSIRITEGALADAADNVVPASQSYRMIRGGLRLRTATLGLASFDPDAPGLIDSPVVSLDFLPFDANRKGINALGVSAPVGNQELLYSLQRKIKADHYGSDDLVLSEDIEVDSSRVKILMTLQIFTNLSGFVAKEKQTISCNDYRFSNAPAKGTPGNCLQYGMQPFLRWNDKSSDGRLAGSGAYIAIFEVKVAYEGKDGVQLKAQGATQTWGLRRQKGATLGE